MALRRDTARALLPTLEDENTFIDAVAREITLARLKPKEAEKVILAWFQSPGRVERMIAHALRDEHFM